VSIYQSIEILSKEKGIDPQIVFDAVKDAMVVAARKYYKGAEDLVADFDMKDGSLKIFAVRQVVETVADKERELTLDEARKISSTAEIGEQVRISKPIDVLGRISAQTFKQVILQKVREAERETIHAEYSGRVGELVNCTIKRIEGQDLVVDLGKIEARIPKKEQSRLESFSAGERIRCVIKSVEKTGKNAGVLVSRAAPELVMRLFEQEVPEIYDGTVVIKGCAREAGERTKIAVFSRDRDVDSVGACVGMKGMRVQSIIRELRGEKIDIVPFSDDPVQFAANALNPAKISRVTILSLADHHMEVIVDDTQLSLAIGKKGQNVRLAAKLLGWKIDIKSEEEKRQEVESQMAALSAPGAPVSVLLDHGLAERIAERLVDAGITTVERVATMTQEEIEALPGVGPELALDIIAAVNSYYGPYEEVVEEIVEVTEEETPEGEAVSGSEVEASGEAEPEAAPAADSPEPVAEAEAAAAGETVEVESESPENTTVAEDESDTMKEAN
jgi:N utilization substance protein A